MYIVVCTFPSFQPNKQQVQGIVITSKPIA